MRIDRKLKTNDSQTPGLQARTEQATKRPAPLGRLTILLVDDEAEVCRLVGRILRSMGHLVIRAGDAEQALATAAQHASIDLLITDVMMPGIHGGELARRLVSSRPGLRVLCMSGHPHRQVRAQIGDRAFLAKPFGTAELDSSIAEVMARPPDES